MPYLPARPDLEQLRHQAKDVLRAADAGDREAIARIRAVSERQILASAQLVLAREVIEVQPTPVPKDDSRAAAIVIISSPRPLARTAGRTAACRPHSQEEHSDRRL
jgi:hypothetical protein